MKKYIGKTISLIVVLCCLLSCFSFNVAAAVKTTDLEISLSGAAGETGKEVTVDVLISGNPGIAYLKLKIDYDPNLAVLKAENKDIISGTFTTSRTTDVKPYVLQWMGADNSFGNGVIATVTFKISDDAPIGNKPVTVTVDECYNAEFDDIIFTTSNTDIVVSANICTHKNTVIRNQKAATCSETGYTGDTYCNDCGEKTASGTIIPATGHSTAGIVKENETAPTCEKTGSYDEVTYCNVCNAELSRNVKVIPASGHNYAVVTVVPTCTVGGYTTYTCATCGDSYTDNNVSAIGHNFGEWNVVTPATRENEGLMERVCSVCYEKETQIIEKLPVPDVKTGDVDGDGKITAKDARLALRISAKIESPTEQMMKASDINGDGKVTVAEARKILRVSAKLEIF